MVAPSVAITEVGAPGGAAGTTAPEAAEATDVPSAFVAVTVNVYDVPLVRPGTVHERCAAVAVQFLDTEPTFGDAVTL